MVRQGRHLLIMGIDPETELDKDYVDESLKCFKETVQAVFIAVFDDIKLPLPAESIYKRLQILFRVGYAEQIYNKLSRHCNERVKDLAQLWFNRDNKIENVHKLWKNFQRQMKYIGSLFQVIDQGFVKNSNLHSTRDMCMEYWGLHVMNDNVCDRIVEYLLEKINIEREGSNQSIDGKVIEELLEMCKRVKKEGDQISLYDKHFKDTYHKQIDDFYLNRSQEWIKKDIPAYLETIKTTFKEEEEQRKYSTDMDSVRKILTKRLVADHAETILNKGLFKLLEHQDKYHLELLYSYFKQDQTSLELLYKKFTNYVELYGMRIIHCDLPPKEGRELISHIKKAVQTKFRDDKEMTKFCSFIESNTDGMLNVKDIQGFQDSFHQCLIAAVKDYKDDICKQKESTSESKIIDNLLLFKDALDDFVCKLFDDDKQIKESIKVSFEKILNNPQDETPVLSNEPIYATIPEGHQEDQFSPSIYFYFKTVVESNNKKGEHWPELKKRLEKDREIVPRLLAKHIDILLREGKKNISSGTLGEQEIDKLVNILRFINQKDIFFSFYGNTLSKRLLLSLSADNDFEVFVLTKFKRALGHEYAKHAEMMFKDVVRSRDDTMPLFKKKYPKTTLDVRVLTANRWQHLYRSERNIACQRNIALQLREMQDDFSKFYIKEVKKYSKLTWIHNNHSCEVLTQFKEGVEKVLLISLKQLLCLLLFQEQDVCTYEEIRQSSGLGGPAEHEVGFVLGYSSATTPEELSRQKKSSLEIIENLRAIESTSSVKAGFLTYGVKAEVVQPLTSLNEFQQKFNGNEFTQGVSPLASALQLALTDFYTPLTNRKTRTLVVFLTEEKNVNYKDIANKLNLLKENGVKVFVKSRSQDVSKMAFEQMDGVFYDGDSKILNKMIDDWKDEKEVFERTLQSLFGGRNKIIINDKSTVSQDKNSKQWTFSSGSKFKFNDKFTSNRNRIAIKELRKIETKKELETATDAIKNNRKYTITAAIVRVMKMEKQMTYYDLKLTLAKGNLKKHIGTLQFGQSFKDLIHELIDKEYLQRIVDPQDHTDIYNHTVLIYIP